MSLEEQVVKLLHEKIGFNPESIGADKILYSVRAALKGRTIVDPARFLESLTRGNPEFQEIVDAVIVPETWFFRDGSPFEYLKQHAAAQLRAHPADVLRCLSMPCSTGEEPYSISMALLDAGLAPHQFTVDAVDISAQSLARAKAGNFGAYSFRGANLEFRERYFERTKSGYRLIPLAREAVRFSLGNLLDPAFMHDGRQYDIIFCRNLLIYFDAAAWATATLTLERLLKDSGVLFMGHAELLELNSKLFESVRAPQAFAYRKRKHAAHTAHAHAQTPHAGPLRARKTATKKALPQPDRADRGAAKARAEAPATRESVAAQSAAKGEALEPMLEKASGFADRGQLAQATELCRRCLSVDPANARAHCLLGLIAESGGETADAEKHYKRALYLDPRHHEAMIHLALLLEGRGESAAAANLRKRAKSAAPQR